MCLLGLVCSTSACKTFCDSPCLDLNGDVQTECGDCGPGWLCGPGMPGFPQPAAGPEHAVKRAGRVCKDDVTNCEQYAREGFCEELGARCVCQKTCKFCTEDESWHKDFCAQLPRSNFGFRASEMMKMKTPGTCTIEPTRSCEHGLEDEQNVAARGFFVQRGLVPVEELAQMRTFVADIPLPTRLLCGASDVQPAECMMGDLKLATLIPETYGHLQRLLRRWVDSGFSKTASLGAPVT